MTVIDGTSIAHEIERKLKTKLSKFTPKLATIVVGTNPESALFVNLKEKACNRVGIHHQIIKIDADNISNITDIISQLNCNKEITGINIQLPLPHTLSFQKLASLIEVKKDVEGITPCNLGLMLLGEEMFIPITPKAILRILEYEKINVTGKSIVIVNHSSIIGKPLAILLLNRNATVTVCHEYTPNLFEYTSKADIIVSATGIKGLLTEHHVNTRSIIIDAGIKSEGKKVYGDSSQKAQLKANSYTPVPGGVGPVTIACLLENITYAYEKIN